MSRTRLMCIIAALASLVAVASVLAQDPAARPGSSGPTIASVLERITTLEAPEQEGTLDEEDKTRLQLYRQALESLRAAANSDSNRNSNRPGIVGGLYVVGGHRYRFTAFRAADSHRSLYQALGTYVFTAAATRQACLNAGVPVTMR